MAGPAVDSSRARLLASARTLFARLGYEQTPTSAIAREAGTSESQLVRSFGGKAGLLEAIFEESWRPINARVKDLLTDARDGRAAVVAVLSTILAGLDSDEDLATIFLFEGRRIRGESHQINLSSGFVEFADVVQRLIKRGQKDGSFAASFDPAALAAALTPPPRHRRAGAGAAAQPPPRRDSRSLQVEPARHLHLVGRVGGRLQGDRVWHRSVRGAERHAGVRSEEHTSELQSQ